ncbi:hypothetical protein RvY_18573 [Ramazzottius varieornatus]|uniref:Uncharacterized protein n=1 Tax=Ramazzottius varieornatus TaxID=947166 RepID=A0A1D1W697_RAMVA|nr:hypothetical protein RvY_18573 [Ramazzottius varieornatus]
MAGNHVPKHCTACRRFKRCYGDLDELRKHRRATIVEPDDSTTLCYFRAAIPVGRNLRKNSQAQGTLRLVDIQLFRRSMNPPSP